MNNDLIILSYECALLMQKLFEIPVMPVFLAEIDANTPNVSFKTYNRGAKFPVAPHHRNPDTQQFIDELRYIFLVLFLYFFQFVSAVVLTVIRTLVLHSLNLKSTFFLVLH